MDFSTVDLGPDEHEFIALVRGALDAMMTDAVHEQESLTGDGFNEQVHLALAAHGWVMPRWPAERGGAGLNPRQARFLELEMARRRVPDILAGTTRLVWPAVAAHARPDLVTELEPGVAAGTVRFCLGYTEPDGGSDIAAARVRAVLDGEEWVINGSKVFTTNAQHAQFVFLLTRTDPTLPKHRGLTMFLVPLDTPGITVRPINTFGGERSNVVYYGDVRISDRYRLGPVNSGWTVVRGPLDEEHSVGAVSDGLSDSSIGTLFLRELERALDATLAWAIATRRPDGSRVIDDPSVRICLGRVAAELEAALCATGPMGRVLGSETLISGTAELMELIGPESLLSRGADGAVGDGAIERAHRWAQGTATYGGTVEVFRNLIAQHVLGLPRPEHVMSSRAPTSSVTPPA